MNIQSLKVRNEWWQQRDPRLKIVAAIVLSLLSVALRQPLTLIVSLVLGMGIALFAGVSKRQLGGRLLRLNLFLFLLLLAASAGTPAGKPFLIWLRANSALIWLSVLLGSLEAHTLGHALNHLRVPDTFTHVLLLTSRYIHVLIEEYRRLERAMRLRGFVVRCSAHTYRTFSNVLGMVLVRSIVRAERILQAMKCRGYHGHYYLLRHFTFCRQDYYCAGMLAGCAVLLVSVEYLM